MHARDKNITLKRIELIHLHHQGFQFTKISPGACKKQYFFKLRILL